MEHPPLSTLFDEAATGVLQHVQPRREVEHLADQRGHAVVEAKFSLLLGQFRHDIAVRVGVERHEVLAVEQPHLHRGE